MSKDIILGFLEQLIKRLTHTHIWKIRNTCKKIFFSKAMYLYKDYSGHVYGIKELFHYSQNADGL